jgi:alpha-glucosidase
MVCGEQPIITGDEPELEFFNNVPTVWDKTMVLYAETGKIGVIARKKGDEWFIGGINGEESKRLNLSFSFLNQGVKYSARIYTDNPEINTRTRVRTDNLNVDNSSVYIADLKANNGIAIHIKPVYSP